jgi:molecular chaperone GrpE
MPENQTMSEQNRIEPTMDRPEAAAGAQPAPTEPDAAAAPDSLAEAQAQLADLQAKNAQLAEQYLGV